MYVIIIMYIDAKKAIKRAHNFYNLRKHQRYYVYQHCRFKTLHFTFTLHL